MFFSEKTELHLPGPTIVPNEVQRAIAQAADHPMMDYRTDVFRDIVKETSRLVASVLETTNEVMFLAGSGASALEATMHNLVGEDDTVILCIAGFFGEYLAQIGEHIGARVVRVDAEWGHVIDPHDVEAALRNHPEAVAVFVTHCETSTGALNDVEAVAALTANHRAVVVVDAVSSIVSSPLRTDAWGVDMVATGSQKALMLPPGLAIVSASQKAWDRIEAHRCPSYYFDLRGYRNGPSQGTTPFTPNVPLINGLRASAMLILDEGLEAFQRRHHVLRDMTRAGVRAMGRTCLVESDHHASHSLTSVRIDDRDADQLRAVLRDELRVNIGGGLGKLTGRIVRLGHLGYTTYLDMVKLLAAFEIGLMRTGGHVELGAGVAAAQRMLAATLASQDTAVPAEALAGA